MISEGEEIKCWVPSVEDMKGADGKDGKDGTNATTTTTATTTSNGLMSSSDKAKLNALGNVGEGLPSVEIGYVYADKVSQGVYSFTLSGEELDTLKNALSSFRGAFILRMHFQAYGESSISYADSYFYDGTSSWLFTYQTHGAHSDLELGGILMQHNDTRWDELTTIGRIVLDGNQDFSASSWTFKFTMINIYDNYYRPRR